jgi:hypothetical protein
VKLPGKRHFLHAARLRFAHPITGEALDFRAPLPADLTAALATVANDPTLDGDPTALDRFSFFEEGPNA